MNDAVMPVEKDTKTRILDATERLIAKHGFDVPLRAITTEAGVNLAAVNYHFQSKDALFDAIIARRLDPINEIRLRMLGELEARYPGQPLPIEPIIEAFLVPVLAAGENADYLRPLIGRIYSVPPDFMHRIFKKHLGTVAQRFIAALQRARADLPLPEVIWRLQFMAGAMIHVMTWSQLLPVVTHGLCDPSDTENLLKRVTAFFAAGFTAPASVSEDIHA